jgi:hypothetical protein
MKMEVSERIQNFNFDYVGVPSHQRWMNNGKFDGGQLTSSEKALEIFYKGCLISLSVVLR